MEFIFIIHENVNKTFICFFEEKLAFHKIGRAINRKMWIFCMFHFLSLYLYEERGNSLAAMLIIVLHG